MTLKDSLKKMISKATQSPTAPVNSSKKDKPKTVKTKHGEITEQQRACVEHRPEGNLLVRGIPGSGKSTVLLARAQFLEEKTSTTKSDVPKVLVLTYNKALSTYMRFQCKKLGTTEVETNTFHFWALQLLGDLGLSLYCADNKLRRDTVGFAYNTVKKHSTTFKLPKMVTDNKSEYYAVLGFLEEEFSWIKGMDIKNREIYLTTPRVGRGSKIQVTKAHRESIYDVFEKYNEMLLNRSKIDFDEVAILLYRHADRIPKDRLPLHILIDEAQDLSLMQLKAISKLAQESLTIAADKGQQIYRRTFTWKAAGVEIHKGTSKFLDFTFRSTKQIIQLARSLQEHDEVLKKDDEYVPSVDPDTNGPIPEMMFSNDQPQEIERVTQKVLQIRKQYPDDTIGVIAYSQNRMEDFAVEFTKKGIPTVFAKEDSADILDPGVKLISYYSSKGLEFDHVIVTGLKEGKMPFKKTNADEEEHEHLTRERRKLYVAMTRAKLTLTLSAVRKYSCFIDELDSKLYIEI